MGTAEQARDRQAVQKKQLNHNTGFGQETIFLHNCPPTCFVLLNLDLTPEMMLTFLCE